MFKKKPSAFTQFIWKFPFFWPDFNEGTSFKQSISFDENNCLFDKVSAEKHSVFTRFTWKPFEILLDFNKKVVFWPFF